MTPYSLWSTTPRGYQNSSYKDFLNLKTEYLSLFLFEQTNETLNRYWSDFYNSIIFKEKKKWKDQQYLPGQRFIFK